TSWPRDWSSDVCSSDLRSPQPIATTTRHRAPWPGLDGPRVIPKPPVHVAEVAHRHPDGIEARVAVGAEGQVLAQGAIGVQGDAGASFDGPSRGAGLGPRDRVAHG